MKIISTVGRVNNRINKSSDNGGMMRNFSFGPNCGPTNNQVTNPIISNPIINNFANKNKKTPNEYDEEYLKKLLSVFIQAYDKMIGSVIDIGCSNDLVLKTMFDNNKDDICGYSENNNFGLFDEDLSYYAFKKDILSDIEVIRKYNLSVSLCYLSKIEFESYIQYIKNLCNFSDKFVLILKPEKNYLNDDYLQYILDTKLKGWKIYEDSKLIDLFEMNKVPEKIIKNVLLLKFQ